MAFIYLICFTTVGLKAQIVTTNPSIVTADMPVTIIFDATQGNAGLLGVTADVHMHAAAITEGPTSTGWTYKVGEWGDPNVPGKMTYMGDSKWQITLSSLRTYFNVPDGTPIYRIGMVFRESGPCGNFGGVTTTCKAGRTSTGGDIFLEVSQGGFDIALSEPANFPIFKNSGEPLDVVAVVSETADLSIKINGVEKAVSARQTSISYSHTVEETGLVTVLITANNGSKTIERSFNYLVRMPTANEARAFGIVDGINYYQSDPTKVTLSLLAPLKSSVYVLGDFNDWQIHPTYQMKKDGEHFWVDINGLTSGVEYAFQYLVDEDITIGDPFCDKILDPKNDKFIPASVYPDLKEHPAKAVGVVSVLQTNQAPYQWEITNFARPANNKLNVYELLIRDFDSPGTYQAVIDRLDYIKSLGVNAIELMPVNEFNGNISWGYNPIFPFVPDKAYGTKHKLKELIDKAHAKGMAVILDMVLNHHDYEFPYAKMYWSGGKPAENSPWFNRDAKHPYNVYYDFNHESLYTKALVDTVNRYWLHEYKIDGFRFDLSKGFTQTYNTDVGLWGNYDQSRVDILTRMANKIWEFDPTAYVILEHLGVDEEERVLGNAGMMLWDKMTDGYKQNTLGFVSNSSISRVYYKNHSGTWTNPASIVAYMESHDEERLMVSNLEFGNSNGTYNVKNLSTAIERMKGAFAFLFGIPGPKMIWQFGELGYDFSINLNGRTGPKPVRWDYYEDPVRLKLYRTISEILALRNKYEVFHSENVTLNLGGDLYKSIVLKNQPYTSTPATPEEMNVVIVGNFDVAPETRAITFPHAGNWYHYFSGGDQLTLTDELALIELFPGEFRIYTDVKLDATEPELMSFVRPIAPELVSLTREGSGIRVSWTDASEIETGYLVYRRQADEVNFAKVGTKPANTTSFLDTSLESLTEYEYYVEAANPFGKGASNSLSITTAEIITGVVDDVLEQVNIYPNPVATTLTVDLPVDHRYTLELIDLLGKKVTDFKTGEPDFDMSNVQPGVYILKITGAITDRKIKVIKQ